jgi:hypothetical protein
VLALIFIVSMSLTNASRDTYLSILNGCIQVFKPNKSLASSNLDLNKFLSLAIEVAGNPALSKVHKFYSMLHSLEGSQIQSFLLGIGDNNINSGLRILEKDFSIARNPQSELIQALACLKLGINALLTTIESKAKRSSGPWESVAHFIDPSFGKGDMIDLYNKVYHASTLVAFLYIFCGEREIGNRIYQQAILFFYYELLYKSYGNRWSDPAYGLLDAVGRKRLIGREVIYKVVSRSLDDARSAQDEVCNYYEERRNEEKEFICLSRDIFNIKLKATLSSVRNVETRKEFEPSGLMGRSYGYQSFISSYWKPPICERCNDSLYL